MHHFKKSLAIGQAGEIKLLKEFNFLERLGGKKSDYRVQHESYLRVTPKESLGPEEVIVFSEGDLVELKSDSYDMAKTENFFIEIWSDIDKGKIGGPKQALEHGSKYWIYMYTKNNTLFIFDTKELCDYLDLHKSDLDKWPTKLIQNKSWVTMGMTVPRSDLKHLYKEYKF